VSPSSTASWPWISRPAYVLAFGFLPVAFTTALFAAGGHAFAYDFHQAFWPAGRSVLHGAAPYVDPASPEVAKGVAFIYPAVAAVLLAPFAILGRAGADQLFVLLNIASVGLLLWALRVRDWRLYGLSLLLAPVVYAWHLGNVTLPIALGVAMVWRWRDRDVRAGALVAILVSVKVFVWPLGLWLLATRRYRTFGYAAGTALAVNIAAWAMIGFQQIGPFRQLLAAANRLEEAHGYSSVALAMQIGLDRSAAHLAAVACTAIAAAWCWSLGRHGRDAAAMATAVGVCLVASPIVWLPYFSLLLIPLALYRPRLSGTWYLAIPLWACPIVDPTGWQRIIAVAGMFAIAVALSTRGAAPRYRRAVVTADTAAVSSAASAAIVAAPSRNAG
jgi:hypothetical protein